nr:hypothetical protein [Tanacetum cinerariifolium]
MASKFLFSWFLASNLLLGFLLILFDLLRTPFDSEIEELRTESGSEEILDPNLTNVDQTKYEEEDVDEGVRTPFDNEFTDEEKLDDKDTMDDEEDDEVFKELYEDVNVNVEKSSSVSFDFTSKFRNLENPSPTDNEIESLMETSAPHATEIPELTSSFTTTTPPPHPFFNPLLQQQKPTISTPTYTNPTVILPEIPNFTSVFKFDQRYLASKMKEAVNVAVQLQTNKLREEAQAENKTAYIVAASLLEFELKKILIDKIEANKSIDRSDNQKNLYNALVESYNSDKDILTSYGDVVLLKRGRDNRDKDEETSLDQTEGRREGNMVTKANWIKKPERPLTLDPDWSKRRQIDFRPPQTWITQAALAEEPPTSFDEFNDTSFNFSAFALNRLQISNLTREILVGLAFNLLKGIFKSITELEYHLEECSKATAKLLDWHNLENKLCLFDLRKPFSLIQDHQGRQIIPKD